MYKVYLVAISHVCKIKLLYLIIFVLIITISSSCFIVIMFICHNDWITSVINDRSPKMKKKTENTHNKQKTPIVCNSVNTLCLKTVIVADCIVELIKLTHLLH